MKSIHKYKIEQHRQLSTTIPATWGRYQYKSQKKPIESSSPTTMNKYTKETLAKPLSQILKRLLKLPSLAFTFPELHLQLLDF